MQDVSRLYVKIAGENDVETQRGNSSLVAPLTTAHNLFDTQALQLLQKLEKDRLRCFSEY